MVRHIMCKPRRKSCLCLRSIQLHSDQQHPQLLRGRLWLSELKLFSHALGLLGISRLAQGYLISMPESFSQIKNSSSCGPSKKLEGGFGMTPQLAKCSPCKHEDLYLCNLTTGEVEVGGFLEFLVHPS